MIIGNETDKSFAKGTGVRVLLLGMLIFVYTYKYVMPYNVCSFTILYHNLQILDGMPAYIVWHVSLTACHHANMALIARQFHI